MMHEQEKVDASLVQEVYAVTAGTTSLTILACYGTDMQQAHRSRGSWVGTDKAYNTQGKRSLIH